MKTLVIATGNAGKAAELRAALPDVTVQTLKDHPQLELPPEDAPTFEGNARVKAEFVSAALGLPALADDSGLVVEALGGAPGVYSARYAPGTDADRWRKLLSELDGVADRRAHFHCAMAFSRPGAETVLVEGQVHGEIGLAPAGEGGFGYDPVFRVEGGARSMAELNAAEKNAISHRGRALAAILPVLKAAGAA